MKKILCVFLLFIFMSVLISCDKKDNKDNNPTTNSTVEPTPDSTTSDVTTPDSTTPDSGELSQATVSFSDKNSDKIITTPTFDISKYTNAAGRNIQPSKLFGNGMVLQREAINRIWGNCLNNENIAIEIDGKVYYGTVKSHVWEVYLPKMNAGGPYNMTIISEGGRLTLTNIYIGEVFLVSGQSNMEFQPQHSGGVLDSIHASTSCNNDNIRFYQVGWSTPTEPTTEAINGSSWKAASQQTIPYFSAVGYLFGKQMQEELGCPIGLIANPVGGSSIEFWLSEENYNKVQEIYNSYTTTEAYMTPCLGYNGMLYPLTGLNLRGIVWYQGESNAFGTQEYYDQALEIYMKQCRQMFDNEQLIFTICELARYEGNPYAYSIVNEKINKVAASDPYVVVARNLDQGEWTDIHPRDKRVVASRAASETLRVFFGQEIPTPIEIVSSQFLEDGSVVIELSSEAKLVNENNGFEVYVDGKFTYNCEVAINGRKITITADGKISRVRYGYTCKMTEEIRNDVSKMVTIYDNFGNPLDLFYIIDESGNQDGPVLPDAPMFSVGYNDAGFVTTKDEDLSEYTIVKQPDAVIWGGARLDINGYNSTYTKIRIKYTSTNITNLVIELIMMGGEADWAPNVSVYQAVIADGTNEIIIDFSETQPISTVTWGYVDGYYIKDYQIVAINFALDTNDNTVELEEGIFIINEIEFLSSK